MIKLASPFNCTGCASCVNICPKDAISMKEDNEGFLFPEIDSNICIQCRKCELHCPILLEDRPSMNYLEPTTFALWSKIDRTVSSSGGAFSAFARYCFQNNGIVYGVILDSNMNCRHMRIDTIQDLPLLRGSKYIQSNIGYSFRECQKDLQNGKLVLFTGTPCQIAGLQSFLGKQYDNLITLDLVCHGVPSNKIFKSYINKLQRKYGEIKQFSFRKLNGWGYAPSVELPKRKRKLLYGIDNLYMTAFDRSVLCRECCYECRYAKLPRVGDCTIADFWGIGKYGKKFAHSVSKGVSLVFVNNAKGANVLAHLTDITIEQRSLNEALIENNNIIKSSVRPAYRNEIIAELLDPLVSLNDMDARFRIINRSLKERIKECTMKMHVYDFVKKIYNILVRI